MTENEIFRPATEADADRCWQILQQGKAQMLREGKKQWTEQYPSFDSIRRDLDHGYAYVLERDGSIIAYGAIVFDGEPAYEQIRDKWLTNQPYVVVHRLAVADEAKRQGVAARFMALTESLAAERGIKSFKIDTNFDNFYMQKLLSRCGFTYCGDVVYTQGSRLAFEKVIG